MNKQEKKQKGFFKFKKRLQNFGYRIEDIFKKDINLFCLKTTSKPCSCYMCSEPKFNRKIKHKNKEHE